MSITWADYMTWTHETAMRKVPRGPERVEVGAAAVDDREVAELLEIWALGLGGEFLEMLAEDRDTVVPSQHMKLEAGDFLYYMARCYVDTRNVRRSDPLAHDDVTFRDVVRHVGRLIETFKKALRKEGRPGLVRLTISNDNAFTRLKDKVDDKDAPWGRREEIGGLLDLALSAFERWLKLRHCDLVEVMEMNQAKLVARKAAGTIASQEERK